MREEEIPFKDIPEAALKEASSLQDFLAPMFVMAPPEKDQPPRLSTIGSGTLVEIQGSYAILTAGHVWNAVKGKDLGLALTTQYPSGFWMKADSLSADVWWHGRGRHDPLSAWGPDLALVRLHRADVERINAHKVFLNLSRRGRSSWLTPPRNSGSMRSRAWSTSGLAPTRTLKRKSFRQFLNRAHSSRLSSESGMSAKITTTGTSR